jgi:hypothetical protein
MDISVKIVLIQKLTALQKQVINSTNKTEICNSISTAINLAAPAAPYVNERIGNFQYKMDSKQRNLAQLAKERSYILDGTFDDWDVIHFQVATSLESLKNVFGEKIISNISN